MSRQNILNWAQSGIIRIHDVNGKKYWLDACTVEALKDVAEDTAEQERRLAQRKEELRIETEELERKIREVKQDLGFVRRTGVFSLSRDFYASIPKMLCELGVIYARERDVLIMMIEEKDFSVVAEKMGLTRERVRQIFVKAVRKSSILTALRDKMDECDKVKTENSMLRATLSVYEKELDAYRMAKVERELMDAENSKSEFLMRDSLCKLLCARVADQDFSVRALNCLFAADIKTIGDLARMEEASLLRMRNFGKRTLGELKKFLEDRGLSFGMDVDNIFRERYALLKKEGGDEG